jgi:AraC-like DNA-binding protein
MTQSAPVLDAARTAFTPAALRLVAVDPPLPALATACDRRVAAATVARAVHALGLQHCAYEGTPYPPGDELPPLIPVEHALRIAANVARRAPDPYLHFRVARVGPAPFGTSLALALHHAPTLLEALDLAAAWSNAAVPLLDCELVRTAHVLECRVRPRVELGDLTRPWIEMQVDLLYRAVEWRRGLALHDASVLFAHAPAARAVDYGAWLQCDVRFAAGRSALVVPLDWCELRAPGADPGLWLLARDRVLAEIRAAQEPDRVQHVRRRVATRLAQGQAPRLKQLAADCGVSTRTLIRTLRLAGTTFHDVVDAERRARAIELILRPTVSLAQLASELGFPDRSSFGRRFREWFGASPARFRRDAGRPPAPAGAGFVASA